MVLECESQVIKVFRLQRSELGLGLETGSTRIWEFLVRVTSGGQTDSKQIELAVGLESLRILRQLGGL